MCGPDLTGRIPKATTKPQPAATATDGFAGFGGGVVQARIQQQKDMDAAAAEDLKTRTDNNQAVQADLVTSRRRRAAMSLLAQGNPFRDKSEVLGNSALARASATALRPILG